MSVSAVSSGAQHFTQVRRAEATEGPGPDHDGDGDDAGAARVTAQKPQVGDKVGGAVYL